MSQPQTQLQELESAILQRRQYLQAQDNQVQRNLDLLKQQNQQLKANKASLAEQDDKLASLKNDSDRVLAELRLQAEKSPSQRHLKLLKSCQELEDKISLLMQSKLSLENSLKDSESHLAELDDEIIEADAIQRALIRQTKIAKDRLKQAESSAQFQVEVVMRLQDDADNLDSRLERAKKNKLVLEQQTALIERDIAKANQELKSLDNSLVTRSKKLEKVTKQLADATEQLNQTVEEDRDFRIAMADDRMKLQKDQAELAAKQEALKKEIQINEQTYPDWQLNANTKPEPNHYKL